MHATRAVHGLFHTHFPGGEAMEGLLFGGILLVILALLGFGGVVRALAAMARVLLAAGAVMIVLSLVL